MDGKFRHIIGITTGIQIFHQLKRRIDHGKCIENISGRHLFQLFSRKGGSRTGIAVFFTFEIPGYDHFVHFHLFFFEFHP